MKDFGRAVFVVLAGSASGPDSARAISALSAKRAAAVAGRLNFPPNDGRNTRQPCWWSYNQDERVVAFRLLPPRPPPQIPGGERNRDINDKARDERPMLAQHPINETKCRVHIARLMR